MSRSSSSFSSRWGGPLKNVAPGTRRRALAKSVQRGQRVDDPADAALAVAYATWLMGKYMWSVLTFGILGPLGVLLGALSSNWIFLVLGVAWMALAVTYVVMRARARRSVLLNEPLLGDPS